MHTRGVLVHARGVLVRAVLHREAGTSEDPVIMCIPLESSGLSCTEYFGTRLVDEYADDEPTRAYLDKETPMTLLRGLSGVGPPLYSRAAVHGLLAAAAEDDGRVDTGQDVKLQVHIWDSHFWDT